MEYPGSWDKNLSWAEFSYNSSYQESLKMVPFETLYGRQCRTPLNWIELGEKAIFSPDIVVETEATVRGIQENLKGAKLRQESYANELNCLADDTFGNSISSSFVRYCLYMSV
jgi:hypothetical protein